MNFIKKLQQDVAERDIRIATLEQGLHDIKLHLFGPKFKEDPTIQVADVLRLVREIEARAENEVNDFHNALHDVEYEFGNMPFSVENRLKWIRA
jgi:hypothetical protein